MKTKRRDAETQREEKPLVMKWKLAAGSKTYEGDLRVPDDDGTSTLPMMVNSLLKELAKERPELHEARAMVIEAVIVTPPLRDLCASASLRLKNGGGSDAQ